MQPQQASNKAPTQKHGITLTQRHSDKDEHEEKYDALLMVSYNR
jgi:hypothetical protein